MKRVTITFQAEIPDAEYEDRFAPDRPGETSLARCNREFESDADSRILSVVVEEWPATNIPA